MSGLGRICRSKASALRNLKRTNQVNKIPQSQQFKKIEIKLQLLKTSNTQKITKTQLNEHHRKTLNFETPAERFAQSVLSEPVKKSV